MSLYTRYLAALYLVSDDLEGPRPSFFLGLFDSKELHRIFVGFNPIGNLLFLLV